jgi:SAM-dependent methyltransferase
MNLSDLIRRNDRALRIETGQVYPVSVKLDGIPQFAVKFDPRTKFVLADAHEFRVLETFPRDLGWRCDGGKLRPEDFVILAKDRETGTEYRLWSPKHNGSGLQEVDLNWPIAIGRSSGFDLVLQNLGSSSILLIHGFVVSSGTAVLSLCVEDGVEVGPGTAPFLKPEPGRQIRYIERMSAEAWSALYHKGKADREIDPSLWQHYIVADARHLESVEDGTLNFIFSKHVIEHMVNPLAVIESWSKKLKQGGVITGVVPDLRYTFDLRQPSSTSGDWLMEYDAGVIDFQPCHYQKWCHYTAPYNTPEDLIRRNYSIHAHYYTPENFVELAKLACDRGWISSWFISSVQNNKDFAFVLWRA